MSHLIRRDRQRLRPIRTVPFSRRLCDDYFTRSDFEPFTMQQDLLSYGPFTVGKKGRMMIGNYPIGHRDSPDNCIAHGSRYSILITSVKIVIYERESNKTPTTFTLDKFDYIAILSSSVIIMCKNNQPTIYDMYGIYLKSGTITGVIVRKFWTAILGGHMLSYVNGDVPKISIVQTAVVAYPHGYVRDIYTNKFYGCQDKIVAIGNTNPPK